YAINGLRLVFGRQGSEEMKAIANAFELKPVFLKMDALDLNQAQGVGGLCGVAVEGAGFVEVQGIAEVSAAEIERFALQLLPKFVLMDGGGVRSLLGGLENERRAGGSRRLRVLGN